MTWKCQRVNGGAKCRHVNPGRAKKCKVCGKPRARKRQPTHTAALQLSYEHYERLNGGPDCGICGKPPKPGRRHHRDHEHKGTGRARGLLCWRCNGRLDTAVTAEWLRAAAAYLERAAGEPSEDDCVRYRNTLMRIASHESGVWGTWAHEALYPGGRQ